MEIVILIIFNFFTSSAITMMGLQQCTISVVKENYGLDSITSTVVRLPLDDLALPYFDTIR